jgi:membrane protein implicated in regulation of membrane protease activity
MLQTLADTWWAWIVLGFALGVLEILAPGYIFLGFAIGAVLTGILVGTGLAPAGLALLLLIFAVASVLAWLALRRTMGIRKGQVKIWDRDINDNP